MAAAVSSSTSSGTEKHCARRTTVRSAIAPYGRRGPAKKHPRPVFEPPHAIRAANNWKFVRAGKVLSARQLLVHRLQRSRADMYEQLA